MELEYQLTKADYRKFYFSYLVVILSRKLIILPLVTGILFRGKPFSWTNFSFGFIGGFIFIFLINILIYCLFLKKINRKASKNPNFWLPRRLSLSEDGLLYSLISSDEILKWETVISYGSSENYMWLIFIDKTVALIPRKAFKSSIEAFKYLEFIQSHVTCRKSSVKSFTPPYFLFVILCIIPLIGAFVGVLLIIWGLFKYKDQKLVVIGTFGITITILVYSFLFYQVRYSDHTKRGFAKISQNTINTVMKDVEFYKLQHGIYPDSLPQICDHKSISFIIDPLQIVKGKKRRSYFYYQKVGLQYRLFSAGLDGIPNTRDDIYPQVKPSDANKFGLITEQN